MGAAPTLSAQEFLRQERLSELKHEFLDGLVVARSEVQKEHSRISTKLSGRCINHLSDSESCEFHGSDMRVRAGYGTYTYPDGSIACNAEFEDEAVDVLINPIVLFEILSPSTEAYDRGDKFRRYQQIGSLREYVLISTDRPRVEVFSREGDDSWQLRVSDGLGATAVIPSVALDLPLVGLYQRVFPITR
jgi:Uma2 family endonuclease